MVTLNRVLVGFCVLNDSMERFSVAGGSVGGILWLLILMDCWWGDLDFWFVRAERPVLGSCCSGSVVCGFVDRRVGGILLVFGCRGPFSVNVIIRVVNMVG